MNTEYDEDLSKNKFLQELKQQHKTIFQRVIQNDWIICVPRSGSFVSRKFQENEINAHVLIPRKDLSTAQFDTLNGIEILFVDRVLTIKHGDARQYSSRLLFEETFYNTDLCKYCVWCIERPLEANMYILDNNINVISNLQEAVNFLQAELFEEHLCGDLEAKIKNFLCINKDLNSKSIQTQRDLVHDLYMDCLRMLLENTASRKKILDNEHYYWNIRVSLETYILYTLRHVLLKSLSANTAIEDAGLNKIIRNLDEIQLSDLRVRLDLQSRIDEERLELSRLDCFVTVLGKIEYLKRTVNYLLHGTSLTVSSDDLLPVLIFLVIKANLSNWIAQITFMKQFRFSARSIYESDESGFLVTSLEAAIEHIRSGAISRSNSEVKCTKEFISMHNVINQSENLSIEYLFLCIEKGDLSEIKRILACNEFSQFSNIVLCHPLCTCASCEQNWTKHQDLDPYPKNDRGVTPLHVAVSYNQATIVDFFLDYAIDTNIADSDGRTALHYACIRGYQNILLRLLHVNANPTLMDSGGNTPLHLATDRGHENCVKALLYLSEQMRISIDVNVANHNGDTALHLAAKWGYGTIVRVLLECGANCNLTNKKCRTPLMLTQSKFISKLLEYYATMVAISNDSLQHQHSFYQQTMPEDQNSSYSECYVNTSQQRTMDRLLAAIVEGDVCLACYYLGLQVYRERLPDARGMSGLCHPLCDCERCSAIEESLLEQYKCGQRITINACNSYGETALHVSSATGRTEMVRLLLDAGANVNVTTASEGRTPLHLACLHGNIDAAKLLLNCATCDVNARDHNSDTPLHLVTRAGNAKLVSLLIRHGANIDARNQHNMTPLRQLELEMSNTLSANYTEILKILKRNFASRSTVTDD